MFWKSTDDTRDVMASAERGIEAYSSSSVGGHNSFRRQYVDSGKMEDKD